ncbi:MAG: hypothetical protein QM725_00400 [Lacibacter sp.]
MKPLFYKIILYSFILVAYVVTMSLTSAAQSKYKYDPNAPGKWTYTYLNESKGGYRSDANYVLAAADLAVFKKKINTVLETLHQNPVTLNPVGYEATVTASIYANMFRYKYNPANLAGKIPASEIVIRFCPLSREIATGNLRKDCIEVEHVTAWLNYLESTVAGVKILEDIDKRNPHDDAYGKMNEVFQAPEILKKIDDYTTVYANGIMIVAKPGKPYWIPVTAGEYFNLQIKYWTLESEKEGNSMFLDMILHEKKSFTEEQLKMPAYNGENPASLITIVPNERPYMRFNPNFFDKKIPRTSIQMITLTINKDIYVEGFNPKQYVQTDSRYTDILSFYNYSKAIDVKSLEALLDTK